MSENGKNLYFPMRLTLTVLSLCLCLISCGGSGSGDAASMEEFNMRDIRLPDGTAVKVEMLTKPADMARGMMFRDSLPEGRGMLFIHERQAPNGYWMYQVKMPLDIIWMNRQGKVVEMSENTPPCTGKASTCVTYGGKVPSSIVLEVPGGYARKHGVTVGSMIRL